VPGCATGEDAYSLALLAQAAGLELEVTASDISKKSLQRAEEATYGPFSLREVPPPFWSMLESVGKAHRVQDRIRKMVRFREHNLMDPPLKTEGGWDVILCRNVFIYFSAEDSARCAESLAKVLHPDGTLFWGAGELMTEKPRGIYPVSIRDRIAFRRLPLGARDAAELPTRTALPNLRQVAPEVIRTSGKTSPSPAAPRPMTPPSAPNWDELLAREDVAGATQEVLRLSAETPLDPALRMAGGMFLYSSGDYRCALQEFRTALVLDSSLWPAALYEGLCLEGLGLKKEAVSSYRAAEASLASRNDASALPAVLRGLGSELRDMVKLKARAQL
jgi:chemotaxis protein methyltransferase CheR